MSGCHDVVTVALAERRHENVTGLPTILSIYFANCMTLFPSNGTAVKPDSTPDSEDIQHPMKALYYTTQQVLMVISQERSLEEVEN